MFSNSQDMIYQNFRICPVQMNTKLAAQSFYHFKLFDPCHIIPMSTKDLLQAKYSAFPIRKCARWGANLYFYLNLTFIFIFVIVFVFSITNHKMCSAVESTRWGANLYLYLYLTVVFVYVIVFVLTISNQKMFNTLGCQFAGTKYGTNKSQGWPLKC